MKYQGKPFRLSTKMDEPSNIKWENLDMSARERRLRSCVVFFVVVILLAITFLLLLTINMVKPDKVDP